MSCNGTNSISNNNYGKLTVEKLINEVVKFENIESFQASFSNTFSKEKLTSTTISLNLFLSELELVQLSEFPSLSNRISNSIITPVEITEFASEFKYTLEDINKAIPLVLTTASTPLSINGSNTKSLISNLDYFFAKNISPNIMGSVCSHFSNNFANVVNVFSTIQALVNGDMSLILNMFNLIKKITDKMFTLGKDLLQNIGNTIAKIANGNAFNIFSQKLLAIQSLFTDTSKGIINSTIEATISSMVGQFKSITGDVLAYILYKICQISSNVEQFLMDPVKAINQQISGFTSKTIPLETFSNQRQVSSINSGAARISQDAIILGRSQLASNVNSQNYSGDYTTPGKYISLPVDDFERSLVVNLSENGNQFIQFSERVKNMEKIYPSSIPANNIEGAGWRKVHPDVYIRIFRVADRLGQKLLVNSAYRNENYNASVGGKSRSLHMSGMALDISMNGINPRQFIKYASEEGFTGIGTYNTFIHVDIGNRRTWGSNYSDALSIHDRDGYRNG